MFRYTYPFSEASWLKEPRLQHSCKQNKQTGLTLSEILLALGLLGIIAAFCLFKIIPANQEAAHRQAVIKEVVASMYDIMREGMISGDMNANNMGTYVMDRMNAITTCRTEAAAQGCWDEAKQGDPIQGLSGGVPWGEIHQPGLLMPNGANVVGLDDCCDRTPVGSPGCWDNGIVIDYNGIAGPNKIGEDTIWLDVVFGPNKCIGNSGYDPGTILPINLGSSAPMVDLNANKQLYDQIFK